VTFDYRAAVNRAPGWARKCVLALEWAYNRPSNFVMRAWCGRSFSFGTAAERIRVLLLLTVRIVFFRALALISVKAVLLYALAYMLFLTVVALMDAFPAYVRSVRHVLPRGSRARSSPRPALRV